MAALSVDASIGALPPALAAAVARDGDAGKYYDPTKLAGALAAQVAQYGHGNDGRDILGDAGWLSILKPLAGLKMIAPHTVWAARPSQNDGGGDIAAGEDWGLYQASDGQFFRGIAPPKGQDQSATYVQFRNKDGQGFNNVTGSSNDKVQPVYKWDAKTGTATPIASGVNYLAGMWVDFGRRLTEIVGTVVGVGFGGAALLGAGAAPAGTGAAFTGGGGFGSIDAAAASAIAGQSSAGAGIAAASNVAAASGWGAAVGELDAAAAAAIGAQSSAGAGIAAASNVAAAAPSVLVPGSALAIDAVVGAAAGLAPSAVPAAVGAASSGLTVPTLGQVGQVAGLVSSITGAVQSVVGAITGQPTPGQAAAANQAANQAAAAQAAKTRGLVLAVAGAAALVLVLRK